MRELGLQSPSTSTLTKHKAYSGPVKRRFSCAYKDWVLAPLRQSGSLRLKMLEDLGLKLRGVVNASELDLLNELAVLFHLSAHRQERVLNHRGAKRGVVIVNSVFRGRLSLDELELILAMKNTIGPGAEPVAGFLAAGRCQIYDK